MNIPTDRMINEEKIDILSMVPSLTEEREIKTKENKFLRGLGGEGK